MIFLLFIDLVRQTIEKHSMKINRQAFWSWRKNQIKISNLIFPKVFSWSLKYTGGLKNLLSTPELRTSRSTRLKFVSSFEMQSPSFKSWDCQPILVEYCPGVDEIEAIILYCKYSRRVNNIMIHLVTHSIEFVRIFIIKSCRRK